jgi:hypothetical protein
MIFTVLEKIESAEAEMDVKWTYKTQGQKAFFLFKSHFGCVQLQNDQKVLKRPKRFLKFILGLGKCRVLYLVEIR